MLLSRRDGARLVAGTRPGPALLPLFEAELRALVEEGFTPAQALGAIGTLTRYVNGFVLDEQAVRQSDGGGGLTLDGAPTLLAAIRDSGDSGAGFERGLRIVVDGIAAGRGSSS